MKCTAYINLAETFKKLIKQSSKKPRYLKYMNDNIKKKNFKEIV